MNKTKIQIIDETVEVYSVPGSRSIAPEKDEDGDTVCLYNGEGGKCCAFARVVQNPEVLEEGSNAHHLLDNDGDKIIFKDGYGGHEKDFWYRIQRLHDLDGHWDESGGLTHEGRKYVQELKRKYADS